MADHVDTRYFSEEHGDADDIATPIDGYVVSVESVHAAEPEIVAVTAVGRWMSVKFKIDAEHQPFVGDELVLTIKARVSE